MANIGIVGGNHALVTGQVLFALAAQESNDGFFYRVEPTMDHADFTNAVLLTHKVTGNRYIVEVTPQDKA